MNKQVTSIEPPINKHEQNAACSFRITIRDKDHFYKLVHWLNTNVGKGIDKWTMDGHVLKKLKKGTTANPKVYIFRTDFDVESSVYLSLL